MIAAPSQTVPADAARPWAKAERILVIRLGALGDVIRTRFAFEALRGLFPAASIDWLVEDRAVGGLVGITGLNRVIELPRNDLSLSNPLQLIRTLLRVTREIRAHDYQLSVDFHSILKSAAIAYLSGIPCRVGYGPMYARDGAHLLMSYGVDPASDHLSRFDRNAALVRFLGGSGSAGPPPLALEHSGLERVELPEGFCVLHPGTSASTRYKRWPAVRFAEVAKRIHERHGLPALVTYGPVAGEREAAEAVVRLAGDAAALAPPTDSLEAMLALLRRARLFIGADSGPLHLASLAGCPPVAVFGPTDPVENAPAPGVPSRVVRVDVGCNPCREGCPARTCLAAVEPDAVVEAASELLIA